MKSTIRMRWKEGGGTHRTGLGWCGGRGEAVNSGRQYKKGHLQFLPGCLYYFLIYPHGKYPLKRKQSWERICLYPLLLSYILKNSLLFLFVFDFLANILCPPPSFVPCEGPTASSYSSPWLLVQTGTVLRIYLRVLTPEVTPVKYFRRFHLLTCNV